MTFGTLTHPTFTVFELLKEGEVLVVPTDNPMTEKEAWLAFRDVVHGLEYRESCLHIYQQCTIKSIFYKKIL